MRQLRAGLAAAVAALALAACGGGSSGPEFKSVVVFGDSLADVGTFGYKFTVQKAGDRKGYPLWTQMVADSSGASGAAQCNGYAFSPATGFARNSDASCTNYAIGGARIATGGGASNPLRVSTQMEAHAGRGYDGSSLVLIDGGGNDAADLVGAYLGLASGPAGAMIFRDFLIKVLPAATVDSQLATAGGPERLAGAYMAALADNFYASIRTQVLDRGARNVVVLNVPDITLTPRFRAVIAGVQASAGAATATALQAGVRAWTKAFNDQLLTLRGSDPRVIIIDFNGTFSQQVASPSSFGLSNAVDTACPVTGREPTGLPTWDLATCVDAELDKITSRTAGWWKTYTFSDGFHPTPYGHTLMSDTVLKAMKAAGWI